MICFLAAGVVVATLATQAFTLSWTHSVEKVDWQEDWRVENDRLIAVAARVQGSGAGMEPPADARPRGGWWHYRPALPPQQRLVLSRSRFTADYTICWDGACRPLADIVPLPKDPAATTIILPCTDANNYP